MGHEIHSVEMEAEGREEEMRNGGVRPRYICICTLSASTMTELNSDDITRRKGVDLRSSSPYQAKAPPQ